MIYPPDMYACRPEMDVEVLKHLERGKVVSTRIEPPLHPDARESIERLWYRT